MLNLAISAMLIWLAINIAFVVLRLRTPRHSATSPIHRPSSPYPDVIPLRHRPRAVIGDRRSRPRGPFGSFNLKRDEIRTNRHRA